MGTGWGEGVGTGWGEGVGTGWGEGVGTGWGEGVGTGWGEGVGSGWGEGVGPGWVEGVVSVLELYASLLASYTVSEQIKTTGLLATWYFTYIQMCKDNAFPFQWKTTKYSGIKGFQFSKNLLKKGLQCGNRIYTVRNNLYTIILLFSKLTQELKYFCGIQ